MQVSNIESPNGLNDRRMGMRLDSVIKSAQGGFRQAFEEGLVSFRANHRPPGSKPKTGALSFDGEEATRR